VYHDIVADIAIRRGPDIIPFCMIAYGYVKIPVPIVTYIRENTDELILPDENLFCKKR
jgi:hypothetical protein